MGKHICHQPLVHLPMVWRYAPIETYYPDMQRYIDYLSSKADNHIIAYGLGDWFDIGPESPGESQLTSNGVTATAIYYYDVTLMEKMANLLGKPDDACKYQDLAAQIKQAFNQTFWNPSTRTYDRNSPGSKRRRTLHGTDNVGKQAASIR